MSTHIRVAVPNTGTVHTRVTQALIHILQQQKVTQRISLDMQVHSPVDNCRNHMVADALSAGADWLLFMDSDNPPERNPLELIEHGLPIVGCPTPMWSKAPYVGQNPIIWNVFDEVGDSWRPWDGDRSKGLVEVDAVGTGCMLIRRDVLNALRPAFVREWNREGFVARGSDLLFCRRARAVGFSVHVHWGYWCRHCKETDLSELAMILHHRDPNNRPHWNPNTPAYWDKQWKQRGERILPVYGEVLKHVRQLASDVPTVLDYGCGRGDLLAMLTEAGCVAVGTDISQEALEICGTRGLATIPLSEVPQTGWDAIVCTEVLEHLDDDQGKLSELLELSRRVLFTVPNNCMPPGYEPEHRRMYTRRTLPQRFPQVKWVQSHGNYLLALAERD